VSAVIDLHSVREAFVAAFTEFLKREATAIVGDVNERNNCGRLSIYLERQAERQGWAGYYADVEFNRMQNGRVKTILDRELKVVTINCDLILHSRGERPEQDNLIAVEFKKRSRPSREKIKDHERLRALTSRSFDGVWSADGATLPEHVCGYALGVFVEVDRRRRLCKIDYFADGQKFSSEERDF
jgi:hypothetical protein